MLKFATRAFTRVTMIKMFVRLSSFAMLFALQLLACIGCSVGNKLPDMGSEDGAKVALTIEDLNEVKHNTKRLGELFVTKESIPDAKKLNQYVFYVKGKPSISGSTAKSAVLIERNDGTAAGEKEWSFENVSGKWRIKSAPIP